MESNNVGTVVPGDTAAGSSPAVSATRQVAERLYDRLFTEPGQSGNPPAAAMCEAWPDWSRVNDPEVRATLVALIEETLG